MLAKRLQEQTEGLLHGVMENTSCVCVCVECQPTSISVSTHLDPLYLPLRKNWHFHHVFFYLLPRVVAARRCAPIALKSARKWVEDCSGLVTRWVVCVRPGSSVLCFFSPRFQFRNVFFSASIYTLDLCSLLFCTKMKSETQNIYNFCMEKKKKCKEKEMEIIFYCVG